MRGRTVFSVLIAAAILPFVLSWPAGNDNAGADTRSKGGKSMLIKSSVFKQKGMIPSKYTCDGSNVSPPLEWGNAPEGTKSYALICEDPDAPSGTFTHWVAYDIPADADGLPEKVTADGNILDGMGQGKNSFNQIGYGGPCPPGGTHRYYFKLYALDSNLNLKPGVTKEVLLKAMEGHILAQGELMGRYQRH